MKAIVFEAPGDESVLRIGDAQEPPLGPGKVRVRVVATAVNRADLLQRRGLYPPPAGASPILGLECAGDVVELGQGATDWQVGDKVMALLSGGGYAESVVVDAGSVMKIPAGWTYVDAAASPETFITAYLNIFELGQPPACGAVLVHGGSGGVGTAAIQMCKEAGLHVLTTCGSRDRCARARILGAEAAFSYRDEDFAASTLSATHGQGVDVVLDCIGGPYLAKNLACLKMNGTLVVIGLMGGNTGELPLGVLLAKRLRIIGSTLRSRSDREKATTVKAFVERFGPAMESGRLRPVVDRVLPLRDASIAHAAVHKSEHFGKIVLRVAE